MRTLGLSRAGPAAAAAPPAAGPPPGSTPLRPLDRWDTVQNGALGMEGPASPGGRHHRRGRRSAAGGGRGRRHSVSVTDAAVAFARRLSSLHLWASIAPEPGGAGAGGAGEAAGGASAGAAQAGGAGAAGGMAVPAGWAMVDVVEHAGRILTAPAAARDHAAVAAISETGPPPPPPPLPPSLAPVDEPGAWQWHEGGGELHDPRQCWHSYVLAPASTWSLAAEERPRPTPDEARQAGLAGLGSSGFQLI
jgi:hypothetical protein